MQSLPPVGLGTYRLTGDGCTRVVERAIDMGYRHVDTAEMYGNETAVGAGLAAADVPREELVVASKLWQDSCGAGTVRPATEACRDRLGIDVIDLMYVHWPTGEYDPAATLPAIDALVGDGLVAAVGLSNFTRPQLEEARATLESPIAALQVECHPLLPQADLRAYCADHGIQVVGYAPIARGAVMDVPELQEVAEAHDATPAQVSLAWLREKGVAAIPKTESVDHLHENLESRALQLTDADVGRIDAIDRERRVVNPGFAPW